MIHRQPEQPAHLARMWGQHEGRILAPHQRVGLAGEGEQGIGIKHHRHTGARDHGARFWACPANLDLFDAKESDLIEECSGMMSAADMIERVMSDEYRVLTY